MNNVIEVNFGSKDRGYIGRKVTVKVLDLPEKHSPNSVFWKNSYDIDYEEMKDIMINNQWEIVEFYKDNYELKCIGNSGIMVEDYLKDLRIFVDSTYLNFK